MESSNSELIPKNIYHHSKIYKLVSAETDNIYIGSTCNTLSKRMSQHKNDYKRWAEGAYHFVSSLEIAKYNDCQIILIEEFSCENKDQLHSKKRGYLESNACINRVIRVITTEREKKELKNKHQKEYRSIHKDQISIKQNQKFTCICSGKFTRINKAVHDKTIMHKNYIALQNTIIPEMQNLQI